MRSAHSEATFGTLMRSNPSVHSTDGSGTGCLEEYWDCVHSNWNVAQKPRVQIMANTFPRCCANISCVKKTRGCSQIACMEKGLFAVAGTSDD